MNKYLTPKIVITALSLLVINFAYGQNSANQSKPSKDSAMVISVVGDVVAEKDKVKLTPLIRIQSDEVIDVANYGKVEIVYFVSGQKEDWRGPAKFKVGTTESVNISGQPFSVSKTSGISKQLSDSLAIAGGTRVGMVRVRGASKLSLQRMEEKYTAMKKQYPDSILPEVVLLSDWEASCEDDRIKAKLSEIEKEFMGKDEAKILISLYSNRVRSEESQEFCKKLSEQK